MSKILEPGLGDPLGIHPNKRRPPEKARGKQRERIVANKPAGTPAWGEFAKEHGGFGDKQWAQYYNTLKTAANKPPPSSAPAPAPITINYPDYPKPPRAGEAAAKTVAERLSEEAADVAKVKAGEVVASRAQGVSTRLRGTARPAAMPTDDDDKKGSLGSEDSLGLPTLLGSRSRGGQTSKRRYRLRGY